MTHDNASFYLRWIDNTGLHSMYVYDHHNALTLFGGAIARPDTRAAELWNRTGETIETRVRQRLAYFNKDGLDTGYQPASFETRPIW